MIGTVACSTAAIIIKLSVTHPLLLAGYRCLLAGVILSPLYIRDLKARRRVYHIRHLGATFWPGIFLGLHFISWIIGVRYTEPENATLLVMMVPTTMPFFLWIMFRQKLKGAEWLGTVLSMGGVVLLTRADLQLSVENFRGDLLSLLSLLLLTYYLILARVNQKIPSIWLYVVPLYLIAGAFCLCGSFIMFFMAKASNSLSSFITANPIQAYSMREAALFLALALIPTVIGHSIFNYSMQKLPSQLVAIVGSSQFIFTGVMAYYILKNDPPQLSFYIASVLVTGGVVIAIRARDGQKDADSQK